MKRTKVTMDPERILMTNLIVSDQFLREIMPIFRPELLKSGYAREVALWITEYWEKYKTSPGKDIQNIYEHKRQNLMDEDEAENIAEFLSRLSRDWEKNQVNNVEFAVNSAISYLKMRSLEVLKDRLEDSLSVGDVLQGEQVVANYTRIAPPQGEGVDLLRDPIKVASAFINEDEGLFQYPGALGQIAGRFNRGDFVSFLAPMKRGKTWFLWYTAETALYSGYKVLFITLEMTEPQMIRRAWQSLMGSPKEDCEVKLPYFEPLDDDEERWRVRERMEKRKRVDTSEVKKYQDILRKRFRTGEVRIVSFPAFSASVDDIDATIDNMVYYDNFIPDVIIIDYADIVAPARNFRGDYRHQVDDIWKRLRRMAQERNVLLVTVSQSDRSTFYSDVTEINVAEDIRKLAHVTCMLGLSQTKEEAERQIMRVSQVAIREGKRAFDQAVVLYCFDVGRPVLDSRLKKEVILDFDNSYNGDDDDDEDERPKKRKRPRK